MAKGCAPSQLLCTNLCLLSVETELGTDYIWDNYLNNPCVPYQPVLVCCSSAKNSTSTDDLFGNTGGTSNCPFYPAEIEESFIIIPDAFGHVRFSRSKVWV